MTALDMEALENSLHHAFQYSRKKAETYQLGELFAGAGGMALGASKAKWTGSRFRHAWINDIDRDACQTFAHNFPIARQGVFCCDASEMDFYQLPPIDGLAFGFPCNDFSVVGEKLGMTGKFGGLYQWGVRAIRAQKPLFFVAENVGGLAASGDALEIITRALRQSGYRVSRRLYRFEDYGVPQARHRIVFVGFRKDLKVSFAHPEPITKNHPVSSRLALEGISPDAANHELTRQSEVVVERLKYIRPGENVFTARVPDHLQLKMKSNAKISQIYRRLDPDRPAYTVTGSGGGGTHIYHWKENRALTNRERARLQSFPDDFVFIGGKESVRKQIGMAVPPEGSRIIFRAILKTLVQHGIRSQC